MKWHKLLNNQCPKCGKNLDYKDDYDGHFLCTISCGFQISKKRFEEICVGKSAYNLKRDNQELLNNL